MPLVKVIRHGQITLPVDFREELDIKEGDYLEADIQERSIVLRPQVVMDQDKAIQTLHSIMDRIQKRNEGVEPEIIEEEVAEAIRSVRQRKKNHA